MSQPNEKTAVVETVTRLFHALDARDWEPIRTIMTDPIDLEYPSKQGEPEKLSVNDAVSGLKGFLPGFDATQHLLGPVVVEIGEEGNATARFHARVTHVLTEATNDPMWVIGCHYTFDLEQRDDTWKIRSSRVNVLYEEGNRDLEEVARQRAA